jgi:hypothetical protein
MKIKTHINTINLFIFIVIYSFTDSLADHGKFVELERNNDTSYAMIIH